MFPSIRLYKLMGYDDIFSNSLTRNKTSWVGLIMVEITFCNLVAKIFPIILYNTVQGYWSRHFDVHWVGNFRHNINHSTINVPIYLPYDKKILYNINNSIFNNVPSFLYKTHCSRQYQGPCILQLPSKNWRFQALLQWHIVLSFVDAKR